MKNVEKTEGTLKKRISSLSPSEEFQFDVGLRLLVSARKAVYTIKVSAKFADGSITKSITLPTRGIVLV